MTKTSSVKLTYDDSLMLDFNLGNRGINYDKIKSLNKSFLSQYENISLKLKNRQCDFANLTYSKDALIQCKDVWSRYSVQTRKVLFIGIGGALQTAMMLYDAFGKDKTNIPEILFSGNFSDPDEVNRLVSVINGHEEETTIVVLSKSGTTVEPASIYLIFRKIFQDKLKQDWQKHFLFVTSSQEGIFIKEVKENNITYVPTSSVGDRFAPFSSLGLIPCVIFDMDVQDFLEGGRDIFEYLGNASQNKNIAWKIATYQYVYQKAYGINCFTTFLYQTRLGEFNMWLRQLWGESLGKEGKGIVLYPAMGPKDQHSVLQMFNDGPWFSTYLFLTQKKYQNDINLVNSGITDLNHFDRKSITYITNSSSRNSQLTLKNYGRPSANLEIEEFNEETFGSLVALFEMVVVYLGILFNLKNVFDQPGVTESRNFIDARMERSGSQEAKSKIETIEKSIKKSYINYP